ncbi:hypothetical protein WICANDRAFT_27451 [Wickerhamomyces anomalus NRRL Y-366-8]|uniref:Thioredoxin domain-containing protein n=1 Tax=Wickerhamomyces anomalus (strain ATCC 58044 / CBS 1984 / NCYC 433 / NRRL Y-366-8) TaxID=683960 RepID=A0A1E3PAE0_WICAA|nr:uncharacterized protein WICANDRAFT_27451 [Wickerhamomyces anomalus NRRL Y-366-8]ODQ62389.1 hypothetical protein WICANDRAFT_27451 [Wickerhamomyces anomalus NRRL Y-366-8]
MLPQIRSTLFRSAAPLRAQAVRGFRSCAPSLIQVGDSIPSVSTLREGSPGNEVDLAQLTKTGKSIIVGVPGAFSPACSASHVPGYVKHIKEFTDKGYKIFVTAVNDSFVTKAWGDELAKDSGIRFIADPSADFSKATELSIDATPFFGGVRNKRFVLIVEDGKVKSETVEPDNFGLDVTKAEEILKQI